MADLWGWVHQTERELRRNGEHRLAQLIDEIPTNSCDDDHDLVDAKVPEALARARELKLTWLELFLRHWHLQSRILKRGEVADALPEAVALLDFAHQEDTKDCPQSVCTTQDLTNCYSKIDGPGYAEERLAAAQETLSRIDRSWPCHSCISAEYYGALRSLGQNERVVRELEQLFAIFDNKFASHQKSQYRGPYVQSLICMGRYEQAFAFNEKARLSSAGESFVVYQSLDRCRLHILMDQLDHVNVPRFSEVEGSATYFEDYSWIWHQLIIRKHATYDATVEAQFNHMRAVTLRNGMMRRFVDISLLQAELLLGSNHSLGLEILASAREALPRLNKQFDLAADISALEAKLQG